MFYPTSAANLPSSPQLTVLQHLDLSRPLGEILDQTLPILGDQLQCDRVFLYLRSPLHQVGRVPFCWRKSEAIPLIYDPEWKLEPRWLPRQDPMFAAALQCQPSLFIDDVEMADPRVVNRNYERQTFGHRALIHAHLCRDKKLWGILQPCVFAYPHPWSRADRLLMKQVISWLTPLAVEFVIHDS